MWTFLLLSILFPALVASFEEGNLRSISIQFEYKLEVADIMLSGSTQKVVDKIDATILNELRASLPNEVSIGADDYPDIHFDSIESSIYTECFSKSDECALITSTINVSYKGDLSDNSIEFIILRLAQSFFIDFGQNNFNVASTYMFPEMVKTAFKFDLHDIEKEMGSKEIEIFEDALLQVFGSILFQVEGDTDIVDVQFLYQEQKANELDTFILFIGVCRRCTSNIFGETIKVIIESTLHHFIDELKSSTNAIGSTMFDSLEYINFSDPKQPDVLPPLDPEDIFVRSDHFERSRAELWFLWLGIFVIIVVLGASLCVIMKDRNESEIYSDNTNDESDDFSDEMQDVEQSIDSNNLRIYSSEFGFFEEPEFVMDTQWNNRSAF
jgi:Fe-S cluster biogenesis protein NfuA